ncbi:MAG: single-stranded DNA-binding protein [Clostridia bacterium]|jgi:single-strand DNA-binding protein|nr:single-stranded DNA-binding protein [Clostridia bacterium]
MANFNLNKITLGGRLTADPELRQTNSGVMVTSVGLAVNRRFANREDAQAQQTDFFNLVAWRGMAEFISKYFHKGSSICVVGSVQVRNYTDSQGAKRTSVDVVVDEAYFVDSKSEASSYSASGDVPYSTPAQESKFEIVPEDEDLPF